MSDITLYHNPKCGTSRSVLALIREAGIEPAVIEYLETPPGVDALRALAASVDGGARALLRQKEALCAELGLDQPGRGDEELIAAIAAHPILLNRPVVVAPGGTRVCRPAEEVLALLPAR